MILEKVKSDLKIAMKTGDKVKVSVLRMLISATKNREIELKRPLEDEETISSIRSQIKQLKESYEQFKRGKREDLAEKALLEINILKTYLPPELDDKELEEIVKAVISEFGATKKDFGRVMKEVISRVSGRAEGKRINEIVRQHLH
ncbi:MAG: GatB/YqeY domain-containing protein [Deltaproteobacteria bacterium]|nr:MAG: GatB/YqeY domain-containing protein [Deltaproteobacteria bacterium]